MICQSRKGGKGVHHHQDYDPGFFHPPQTPYLTPVPLFKGLPRSIHQTESLLYLSSLTIYSLGGLQWLMVFEGMNVRRDHWKNFVILPVTPSCVWMGTLMEIESEYRVK
jgi:hypothetical protein